MKTTRLASHAAFPVLLLAAGVCAAECSKPLAVLDSLVVQGGRLYSIDSDRFVIERDGEPKPASIGEPLCENDRLSTATDTEAQLLVGDAEGGQQQLKIRPGSTVILQKLNAVELLIGRLAAALHFDFDVVMPLARLAATGTEFEVEVSEQGCVVDQLEGTVQLTSTAGPAMPLSRLQSATCSSVGIAPVAAITADRCQALLDAQSGVDIAARPAVRSSNSIPLYASAEANAVYAASREASICRDDRAARQAVARVRADWGRPQDALRLLGGASDDSAEVAAENQVALGRALLQRGRQAEAIAAFRAASTRSTLVAAETGLGDAERDLGLIAIRGNDLATATQRFDAASLHYSHAFRATDVASERAVQLVNAGDLALLRTRLDPNAVETRLAEAERFYRGARVLGDPPHARLGLAKILLLRAQLIPTQTVSEGGFWNQVLVNFLLGQEAERKRKPFREAARDLLRELTTAVPDFSPGQQLLGEVQYQLGKPNDSRERFRRAIAADPGNTSAYLAYSETLSGNKRDRYRNAYRLIEVPAVRKLAETRNEVLTPTPKTVNVPANPMTSDLTQVSFKDPDDNVKDVTLTNRGDAPATVTSVALSGANADVFRIRSNACAGQAIPAGGSCTIKLNFSAESVGSYRATLEITVDGAYVTRQVRLAGEKVPPPQEPVIL